MSRTRVSIFSPRPSRPRRRRPRGAGPRHAQPADRSPPTRSRRLDVRVPNERDEARTKTLVVYFPSGFYSASYKRVWGWTAKVSMRKLATPIPSADGDITEEVSKITWRATSKSDWIAPGSFEEFGLSMRIPNKPDSDAVLPGPPDLQRRRGRQVERRPRHRDARADRERGGRPVRLRPSPSWRPSLLVPTGVAYAHTPLKSVDPEAQLDPAQPSRTSARRSRPRCRPGSSRSPTRAAAPSR